MKLFSINKNQAAVLTTLLILIFLGAGYFFIYLPNNERRIQEQRFSALRNIDRNIHTKIENSIALLNNLLTAYQKANTNSGELEKLLNYIRSFSNTNFTLTTPRIIKKENNFLLLDSANSGSGYDIRVNNDTREISLSFSRLQVGEKNDSTVYKMSMKFSFKQFILFLLPKDIFDDYIIFSKGKPVYETFPSGISFVRQDSLLGIKNGIGSSGVRNQVISGTEYIMFLQPVGFDANNEWIIGGLLTNRHYQSEKTQLPTQMILLLSTIMLIGMVAFPWLKLYQMGSKDRLTIYDGIASIFISMLLISLIFFVFFNYNQAFRPKVNKDSKSVLAHSISNAFKSEIDTVFHKMEQFDKLVVPANKNIINLNKDSIAFDNGDIPFDKTAIADITRGVNMNQVFWLDKNGGEIINWTVDDVNAPLGNFKTREYFKKIIEKQEYLVNGDNNKRFFLEQVISWTSGTFRSVLSARSKLSSPGNPVVAALSFNFRSLDKVVLPTGYLFAITDQAGNVLYHSEPSRNLNENLLKVFSKSNQLKSCLDATVQGTFSTRYYGNEYEVEVKPINGLPYSIVIFEDAVFRETTDMEIYSFTFSMLFLFFSLLVLQLYAIFMVSAKRSFFKKQLLDTSWIGPKISSKSEYILSTVFNSVLIFLLILFFKRSSFLEYFFMLLFSVMVIPLFLNTIFAIKYSEEKRNVLKYKTSAKYCLWGIIILIGVVALKVLDRNHFITLMGYEILVIIMGALLCYFKEKIYFAAYRLKTSEKGKLLFGRWNYVNSFTLMSVTRLIITSALPVVFFYISSHNYEQNLSIRYKQVDFANRLLSKFPGSSPAAILNARNGWNGVYIDSSLVNHVSVLSRRNAFAGKGLKSYSPEEKRTLDLLNLFRLYITDKAIIEDKFYSPGTVDSSYFFNPLLEEACATDSGTITYRQSSLPGQYLRLQSENLNYHYPSAYISKWFNGALFWLLVVVTLLVFYFIVGNIVKKLFALNLPEMEVWKKLDYEILVNKNWDQPLFVIGLPGAGKKKYLLDKIADGEISMDDKTTLYYNHADEKMNNVFIAELINIPSSGGDDAEKALWAEYTKKVFDEKNRMIIVNHFEYNIQDQVSNRYKLEFLERLYLDNKCKIVIMSTIHPVAFLDSAMDYSFKPEDKSVPGQDLERWHVLLGHYCIVVLPLQLRSSHLATGVLQGTIVTKKGSRSIPDAVIMIKETDLVAFSRHDGRFVLPDQQLPFSIFISNEGYTGKEVIVNSVDDLVDIKLEEGASFKSAQLIRQETRQTYFLKKMQPPSFQAGKALPEQVRIAKFDELAFKLQVSSHYFYMYIWQSLTKEEKFLLYDLAEDNLVNSFDDYNLSMLIAKGVVIRPDGTLKLFNKGFRNFILSAIGNTEAMKIKNQIKDNGNWSTLKNPIQLVILAILAFLLTSQEEAFSKLITYAAALGAGVPAVLKLFSLFDKSSPKQA